MKIEKVGFIAFPAADFNKSLEFYRDVLELPLIKMGEDDFSKFAHFSCGNMGLHLYEWTKEFKRAHTGLQVYVKDIDSLYVELTEKGVDFIGEVRTEAWGGRTATLSDPDGNRFDLLNIDYEERLKG